jgi:hypothetical protein
MDLIALVLLATTAVVAAVLWFTIDRRRDEVPVSVALLVAAIPALLLGSAALFAFAADTVREDITSIAVVVSVVAAVPGGALIATAVLRLAERARDGHGRARRASASETSRGAGPPVSPATSSMAFSMDGTPRICSTERRIACAWCTASERRSSKSFSISPSNSSSDGVLNRARVGTRSEYV